MYLYYVCWIFDVCQGHSVEQWPTLRIQIFETKKTMDGAKTRQWEGDACYNPLIPFSNSWYTWLTWSRRWISRFEGQVPCSNHAGTNLFTSLHFSNYFHIFYFI